MTTEAYQGNPRLRNVRIEVGGTARQIMDGAQRVTMVPLTIRRKQNRKLLTPPSGSSANVMSGGMDIPMIKTLGKAFYWQRLLDEGKYATATDLARAFKLEPGWVAEVLRMANLAPEIIEAILDGSQPRHLNLQTIRGRRESIPRDWEEQKRLLALIS
jgi:hypothetical protein